MREGMRSLLLVVNDINLEMREFLQHNFGVQIYHVLMKEFKENEDNTPADLLEDFLNCMEKTEKFHFEAKENSNEENGNGDIEENETNDDTNTDVVDLAECNKITDAYIERLVAANRNLTENTDSDIDDDNAIDDENDIEDVETDMLFVEENESKGLLDEVDTGLRTLLHCKSLEEISFAKMKTNDERKEIPLIHGLFEVFHMKSRDAGTVSNAQRHKGLVARYSNKKEKVADDIGDSGESSKFIQRGSVLTVKLKGDDKEKQFVVLALSDKFYGKWYMNEKGFKLPWVPEKMKKVKTRLIARENKKHGILNFKPYDEIEDLRSVHYRKNKPYILIDKIHEEVIDVLGNMEL